MQGFAVIEAASGAEALLSINEHRPDIVTLDLNLPDLDGVEVCRRLRKFSDAYVFMITARVDEIDELIGLETGADDFIGKPFSPRTVQARVAAVLRRHRPTPQRPTPQRRASDFLPAGATDHRARRADARANSGPEARQDAATPGHRRRTRTGGNLRTRPRRVPVLPGTIAGRRMPPARRNRPGSRQPPPPRTPPASSGTGPSSSSPRPGLPRWTASNWF